MIIGHVRSVRPRWKVKPFSDDIDNFVASGVPRRSFFRTLEMYKTSTH